MHTSYETMGTKGNQGNQDSSGKQKNVIQGQRPNKKRYATKTWINLNNAYKGTKVNK